MSGTVPSSDAVLPWPWGQWRSTVGLSRWMDIPLVAPAILAVFGATRLLKTCERRGGVDSLGEAGSMGLALGCVAIGIAVLAAGPFNPEGPIGLTVALIMLATVTFLFGLCGGDRWYGVFAIVWCCFAVFIAASLFSGLVLAFAWAGMGLAVGGVAVVTGRLMRRLGAPLERAGSWLDGEDVTERPQAARPVEKPAPPVNPLAVHDQVLRDLAALESRLATLRTDPDVAKALSLRAERPAA